VGCHPAGYVGVIGTPQPQQPCLARAIHGTTHIAFFPRPARCSFTGRGGLADHPVTRLTAQEYVKPVLCHEIDTSGAGCTTTPS